MGQEICDYCGGSGRDAVIPANRCYKCHGIGTYWVQDPLKIEIPDSPGSSGVGAHPGSRQYQMLPWLQRLLDRIPGWLNLVFAVIGSAAGISLAQALGYSSHSGIALFAVGGFLAGLGLLPLSIVLTDLTIQFTLGLIKIAIVLAFFGGIAYAVLKWTGAL